MIGADPTRDLALIRTDYPISGHAFSIANRAPGPGSGVAALGFPFDLPLTVTQGSSADSTERSRSPGSTQAARPN